MTGKEIKDERCILCHKLKSQHYPCSTNENVLWCYPNSNSPDYNKKKHLDKWAYQFTTKIDSRETKSDSTFAGKNNDVSDSHPDINKNMEKKWDNCERCYNLGIKEGKSWTKQDIDKIISWLIKIKEFNAHDNAWIEKTISKLKEINKL